MYQREQAFGDRGEYVGGGVALAYEYSALVVGEFNAVRTLHSGEGRLLPLLGQSVASQISRTIRWMSFRDSASLRDAPSATSSNCRYLFSSASAPTT